MSEENEAGFIGSDIHGRGDSQKNTAGDLETLGRFAGGVAHDLRNLLSPIMSYSELALEELNEDDVLYYDMEQILEAARCANELSGQLLRLYHRQAQQVEIVNINTVIDNSKKMLRRFLRANIILDFKLSRIPVLIMCDKTRINQILLNMSINAQDAMAGGGRLVVSTARVVIDKYFIQKFNTGFEGTFALLSFSDNGSGVPPQLMQDIFKDGVTTKTEKTGTGIGLATVKDIVTSYGGFINLITESGSGACFNMYFPLVQDKSEPLEEPPGTDRFNGNNERILIVDDDESARRLAVRILDKHGYSVFEASCSDDAMAVLLQKNGKIDLVITDVVMPHMDGEALSKLINKMYPDTGVLLMSGYEADVLGDPSGISALIEKPFSVESLTGAVHTFFNDN
jgi:nitrogen-specific signal transduction histidine kinase